MNLPALNQRKLSLLLAFLLVFLVTGVLVSDNHLGLALNNVLLGVLLLWSMYSVSHNRRFMIVGSLLAAATFVAPWIAQFTGAVAVTLLALGAGFVFFLDAALAILLSILGKREISSDEPAAAVSTYLLLGISGAFVFAFIELFKPGAISTLDPAIVSHSAGVLLRPFDEYIYFSFTCLATLGFGDLVPVSAEDRVLATLEAVHGQIVLTILVARLVGRRLADQRRDVA